MGVHQGTDAHLLEGRVDDRSNYDDGKFEVAVSLLLAVDKSGSRLLLFPPAVECAFLQLCVVSLFSRLYHLATSLILESQHIFFHPQIHGIISPRPIAGLKVLDLRSSLTPP